MIEGPHIFGFSPVALCINLTSALASARLVSSVSASINAATLSLVGLVLLSAIPPAFRFFQRLTQSEERRNSARFTMVDVSLDDVHRSSTQMQPGDDAAHSYRIAVIGSIRDAFRAGTYPA